jgi:hypothetical protein
MSGSWMGEAEDGRGVARYVEDRCREVEDGHEVARSPYRMIGGGRGSPSRRSNMMEVVVSSTLNDSKNCLCPCTFYHLDLVWIKYFFGGLEEYHGLAKYFSFRKQGGVWM